MRGGAIYGVVLNDSAEREVLAAQFDQAPYLAPPQAPVLYIKPLTCLAEGGAAVVIPAKVEELQASPTIALSFGRDIARADESAAWAGIASIRLALDISVPTESYFRPAIAERCRDGFLPVGGPTAPDGDLKRLEIVTEIDGVVAHRWELSRLVRPVRRLISDISAFMTFQAGDTLLVGLPGDAPRVRAGQAIRVTAGNLPALTTRISKEA